MQLHACLLLFIITTDKTLASLHQHCGGNVRVDKEPAGHINLTLPGLITDTNQSEKTLPPSNCTWTIDVPLGVTVLLKLVWLESGSSISVRCVLNEEDKVLKSGETALLSLCNGNKASFTWTGAGHSSNAFQLFYYVQENGRNSSEDNTSPHSDLLSWSESGTSFTSTAPIGQDVVSGTEGSRGRLYEGLEQSYGPQSASSPSSQDQGLLRPTSPLQGLTVAGRGDREKLPLPEEEPNNGADTSGAAHLADGKMSARERTHPYFEQALSTDTLFHTSHTPERKLRYELPRTQMALTRSSDTLHGTDKHEYTATSKLSTPTQDHLRSRVPSFTSSPPEQPSRTTREIRTIPIPRGGAVSGASVEKLPHSWRSQRSTDRLHSDLTSTVTSDPLTSSTDLQQDDSSSTHSHTDPTASLSSLQEPSRTHSSTTHTTEPDTSVGAVEAASFNLNSTDSSASAASYVTSQAVAFEASDTFENTEMLDILTSSTESKTNSPQSTESFTHSPSPDTSSPFTWTNKEEQTATQRNEVNTEMATNSLSSSPDFPKVDDGTLGFTDFSSTPREDLTLGDVFTDTETYTLPSTNTLLHDDSPTNSPTPVPVLSSSTSIHSSTPSNTLQTHTTFPVSSHSTHAPLSLPSITTDSAAHTLLINHKTTPIPSQTSSHTTHAQNHLPLPSSTDVPVTHKQFNNYLTTTQTSLVSLTTVKADDGKREVDVQNESWQWVSSSTTTQTPTTEAPSWTAPYDNKENHVVFTPSVLTSVPNLSSTTSQTPKFYIVPDQPAAIKVESIELLLQILVEDSRSAFTSGLEEDTAAWVDPYLRKVPGFSRLLGVWSSGHAVQSVVEFETSGALQWLGMTGPSSLLERTGLSEALSEGRSFRSSKITNITLGGLQGDVCDWLLQCPAGYKCVIQPGTSNYSCSSVCHFDYCHHHGICTHHPGQLPVCRCLVGVDFWYMGQRCDLRMTRARLVGACLAILLVMVTMIGILALVAVRRYRAILIQAKVDQTRSSYRRFNHFDELSGRFWLRSWAGSADSLDNPAFTRSNELLHLRALDRPCCYHDDTLSLASTSASHGTRINTIYPHSSQYGWRGSEMSMGDGVLDSGKASDLSVCSWPVEPIQWTPFPLLQQLASHRTPAVRVSRPRSYCEGMELVDLGKSWTA